MSLRAAATFGLLVLAALGAALYIAVRLRRLSAQRADAEVRAQVALAQMAELTRELRERQRTEAPEDAGLTPGERLQRRYPGGNASRTP